MRSTVCCHPSGADAWTVAAHVEHISPNFPARSCAVQRVHNDFAGVIIPLKQKLAV
jgi:hypothetical protein